MARELKVYSYVAMRRHDMPVSVSGGQAHHRQVRLVVAAYTQKAAQQAMGVSPGDWRGYGGQTWNEHDIEIALSEPGRVFWAENHGHRSYFRWDGQDEFYTKLIASVVRDQEHKAAAEERAIERAAERQREAECDRAAVDWAERLRREFGVDCEAADNGRVDVVAPAEKLYERLHEIAGVLRDLGMEDLLSGVDQDATVEA